MAGSLVHTSSYTAEVSYTTCWLAASRSTRLTLRWYSVGGLSIIQFMPQPQRPP